jgi:hypothetical protein
MIPQVLNASCFPLADHRPAREAFEQLKALNPPVRVLLLHGPEPESGKTRLLDHCFAKLPSDIDNVRIDMKEVAHPADELLQMLWLKFRERLPALAAARRSPSIQKPSGLVLLKPSSSMLLRSRDPC